MNIIVTCGPSYEPIDAVRRITNFSTGRLGVTLANGFADAGHTVFCLKGEQATYPGECRAEHRIPFTTNDDLAAKLQSLRDEKIGAIFHSAALCDFKVASVEDADGQKIVSKKFPTRGDVLTLKLAPTSKILPRLREWFPRAKIIGWKYEAEGTQTEAIEKAWRQILECRTDGCVLNGPAYGDGFGICTAELSNVMVRSFMQLDGVGELGEFLEHRFCRNV
jgi:phosphopantothenoylcysteine decarboxylase/phosphopantothenate--cysteine ligase